MAAPVYTTVDGQRIKLTNLTKVLYPSVGKTKAEVIQYYLLNQELILPNLSDRALTTIRFPDGVAGKSFYSKDKPKWTPEWIGSTRIQHDQSAIDYLLPQNAADLAWLANLACLELHPMSCRVSDGMRPSLFIFDLDPDEDLTFDAVKECALRLKQLLISHDYVPFVKTSGGKGLHVIVPIIPKYTYEEVQKTIKELAQKLIAQYPNQYTLEIPKHKRKGKILIDIYRNHMTNTTVCAYSLRGRTGAPISMPLRWEDIPALESAREYTLVNYREYLDEHGDAWAGLYDLGTELHDHQDVSISMPDDGRLDSYNEKRDLSITPEPNGQVITNRTDEYVIQLHDASSLHYDLRLEDKGVLLSWAIPKGLPFKKGQKRLAIRTEDHPIKYLDFEGVIPAGQYGAGNMWIMDTGKIKWIKKEDDKSYKFHLTGPLAQRMEYHLFSTKRDNQWLIECKTDKEILAADKSIRHMLADSSRTVPQKGAYEYEVKWDGIRIFVIINDGKVTVRSRSGNDLTKQFPELQNVDCIELEEGVLDGELVVLDDKGRPIFSDVISRMHNQNPTDITIKTKPVVCYLFDMISIDGLDVTNAPLSRRRAWLKTVLDRDSTYRYSEGMTDGAGLLAAIKAQGMEGIMAKDPKSKYTLGGRSGAWLKIKCRTLDQCLIIGYTAGSGDRAGLMGSMHLAKETDDGLKYMGKVGTGWSHQKLKELYQEMSSRPQIAKPIEDKIEEEHNSTWIDSGWYCEIEYASLSSNGTYREPVFLKLIKKEI